VENLNIRTDNVTIASFTGSHKIGKTDEDVEKIVFSKGTMFYIPTGVGQIFKNLKIFGVNPYLSLKHIKRSDFKNLDNLVDLDIDMNEITTLKDDTLIDFPQLEYFTLEDNSLTEIDGRTFEKNVKLKEVYLTGNKLEVLPRNLFYNNFLLVLVDLSDNSLKIIEIDFTTIKNIKEINFYSNPCINAYYDGSDFTNKKTHFRNLTEFQNLITSNCSSM